jgi:hypothetical protein
MLLCNSRVETASFLQVLYVTINHEPTRTPGFYRPHQRASARATTTTAAAAERQTRTARAGLEKV